ncbi:MAG: metallophosphoesterase family protein [Planctomycetes bacterium]|nr:metallophosphoesterase family protein [Planctomycetota bacterium]MBI3848272.1 metallophosphoesterase family protein [Planctomycetota bacterium]
MRYGIVSDLHGNLEALEAVLSHLSGLDVEKLVCLGDIVGYGADPCACIDRMRALDVSCVLGNHDAAVSNSINIDNFNSYAVSSIRWTQAQMQPAHLRFLRQLPFVICEREVCFAHASLHHPEWFQYLRTPHDALLSFEQQATRAAFIGHSHAPISYLLSDTGLHVNFDPTVALTEFKKGLFNVGSVGQPRDQDPRASCAIYDVESEEYEIHRVPYDIATAADKIIRAGLPNLLAERLKVGV